MKVNVTKNTFHTGEIGSDLEARSNLDLYQSAVKRIENFVVKKQGPLEYRPPFKYISDLPLTAKNIIPYFTRSGKSYQLIFTNHSIEIHDENGRIEEDITATQNLAASDPESNKTKAEVDGRNTTYRMRIDSTNPWIINQSVSFWVKITDSVSGEITTALINGKIVAVDLVGVTTDWFEVVFDLGKEISLGSDCEVISGFKRTQTLDMTTDLYDLESIHWVQVGDVIYFVGKDQDGIYSFDFISRITRNPSLTDLEDQFNVSKFDLTVDTTTRPWLSPISTTAIPQTITFYEQRLIVGVNNALYFSAVNNYEDFDESNYTATQGDIRPLNYVIAGANNNTSDINWLKPTDKALIAGTYGGNFIVQGGNEAAPITSTSISIRPTDSRASNAVMAKYNDNFLYYVGANGESIRYLEYSDRIRGQLSRSLNDINEEIIGIQKIKDIEVLEGDPSIIGVLTDGSLIGVTVEKDQGIGWMRIKPTIDDFFRVIRKGWDGFYGERLFTIAERKTSFGNLKTLEYLDDPKNYLEEIDFNTLDQFKSFTKQVQAIDHKLDCYELFNPKLFGNFTIGAVASQKQIISHSSFNLPVVGDLIKEVNGTGLGEVTFVDENQIEVLVQGFDYSEFTNLSLSEGDLVIRKRAWDLRRFSGQEVYVFTEGIPHKLQVNSDGFLDASEIYKSDIFSFEFVGKSYRGLIQTLPLQGASQLGDSYFKRKNINGVQFKLRNSNKFKVGTSLSDLNEVTFRKPTDNLHEAVPLFTGVTDPIHVFDSWEKEKRMVIVKDDPTPLTIQSFDNYIKTEEL
jgi:hypothetical protein